MEKTLGQITKIKKGNYTIHSYLSPEDGDMVCSQIIETPKSLIIIDVLLLRKYAKDLRDYINGLNKKIDRVIITHSHPDHWLGLEFFKDVPSYALPDTIGELERYGEMLRDSKRSVKGDQVTSEIVVPSNILEEGELTIDGLTMQCQKLIGTETTIVLIIKLPDLKTLVAQDVIYNHVYPYIGDKNYFTNEYCFDGWINALNAFNSESYETVLSGHGVPADASIINGMIDYLNNAKDIFQSSKTGEELKSKLIQKYPDYKVTEMLDLSSFQLYESLMGKANHGQVTILKMENNQSIFISEDVAVGEGPVLFDSKEVQMRWTSILLGIPEIKEDGTQYAVTSHHFEALNSEDDIDFTSFEKAILKPTETEGVFLFTTHMKIATGTGRFNAGELVSSATANLKTGVVDIKFIKGKIYKI